MPPKTIKNKALQEWLSSASTDVATRFKEYFSESMFRQWINGRRKMSSAKAGEVERVMAEFADLYPDAPPPLDRGDLCETCRGCPYYRAVKEDSQNDFMNK